MRRHQAQGEQRLGYEVAVAGGIERIRRKPIESQQPLQQGAIHRHAGPRHGAQSQRQLRCATGGIGQPLAVARERPGVRRQHVGPARRLRALPVGVAGQQQVEPWLRPLYQGAAQRGYLAVDLPDRLQRPQPEIGGHLVVARATRVELAGDLAHLLVQQTLHQGVHVLVRRARCRSVGEALSHPVQPGQERHLLVGLQHAGAPQRQHPGPRRAHVLRPEPVVHRQAAVQPCGGVLQPQREAPAPELVRPTALGG